jgi:hypothetical protein
LQLSGLNGLFHIVSIVLIIFQFLEPLKFDSEILNIYIYSLIWIFLSSLILFIGTRFTRYLSCSLAKYETVQHLKMAVGILSACFFSEGAVLSFAVHFCNNANLHIFWEDIIYQIFGFLKVLSVAFVYRNPVILLARCMFRPISQETTSLKHVSKPNMLTAISKPLLPADFPVISQHPDSHEQLPLSPSKYLLESQGAASESSSAVSAATPRGFG